MKQRKQQKSLGEPDKATGSSAASSFIAIIPMVDMSKFDHLLPVATLYNSGGYRLPDNSPAYSPIDLSVALLHCCINDIKLKDLTEFFQSHPVRPIEEHLQILVINPVEHQMQTRCITLWKNTVTTDINDPLTLAFRINAPLTFKY